MRTSEDLNELAAALAKAQAKIENAPLNKNNPHFKNKYADLAAIRDAVTKPLSEQGLSYVQMTGTTEGGQFALFTRLMHTSGQWMESIYPLPVDVGKQQVMGSAITYARRYSLAAVCGVAAEEDDDGKAATSPGEPRQQRPAKTYSGTAQRGNAAQKSAPEAPPTQHQPPADGNGKAAGTGNPIEVTDADGQIEEFQRTKSGALAAIKFLEAEIDRVDYIEDKASLWDVNREACLRLAEMVGDLRSEPGAQTLKERVDLCETAFRDHLQNVA